MEHVRVVEYVCPRCGTSIPQGETRCPGCSAELDWMEERDASQPPTADLVDALADVDAYVDADTTTDGDADAPADTVTPADADSLEEVPPPTAPVGWEELASSRSEDTMTPDGEGAQEGPVAVGGDVQGEDVEDEAPSPGIPSHGTDEVPPATVAGPADREPAGPGTSDAATAPAVDAAPAAGTPPLILGMFTRRGLVAFLVMLVAFAGTIVALRWDTWMGGAEVETIGRMQLVALSLGIATIIMTGAWGVWDAMRSSRA